jgi:hypothetical protein
MHPKNDTLRFFDFFVFSNLYLSLGTVLMCWTTNYYVGGHVVSVYLVFVFLATLCSYCLHWALTEGEPDTLRMQWTIEYRKLLFLFFSLAAFGAIYTGWSLLQYWKWILPLVVLTFLYTAPKIPFRPFSYLKGFALGKTVYLAFVWTAVTVVLPIILSDIAWTPSIICFLCNRFLLFLLSCVLFDYKDRKEDAGIKNLITYINEPMLNWIFGALLCLFFLSSVYLYSFDYSINKELNAFALNLPALLLGTTFSISKKTKNDRWFFVFLDGLMFLTGVIAGCFVLFG